MPRVWMMKSKGLVVCIILFFYFFIWLILSSILALRRALSFPYQWAVSIFALIYVGWSVFYPLLRRKLTDETSQVKLPHRHLWVECTVTSFCFWLNFSLDGHLSLGDEGMFSNLLLYEELGFILMRNSSMLIQTLWDMWPQDFGEELLSVVSLGATLRLSRLFFLSMPLQI